MTFSEQEKKTIFLGIFIAAMIVAGSIYYYIMFVKKEIEVNNTKMTKLSKEIKDVEKELKEMQRFMGKEEEVSSMKKLVETASNRLPSSHNEYEFLEQLIEVLRYSKVSQHALIPKTSIAQTMHTEFPYEINLKAKYHQFGTFLNLVEENPNRFIKVNSFTVANDDKNPSIHPIKVEISTFMFNRRAN